MKRAVGAWLVIAFFTLGARAETDAISPNDPASVQRGIDAAFARHDNKVVIPSGTYRLTADPKSGFHLFFSHLQDLDIDATGAVFLFTTQDHDAIRFDQCHNVTFRGAMLSHEMAPFSQGHVTALGNDGRTIDIRVAKGFSTDFDDTGWINLYDAGARRWLAEQYASAPTEKLGPDTFRFHTNEAVKADDGWTPGASVAWRGRIAPDIMLHECADMKIQDVTITNGSGFCVFEEGGDGRNFYRYDVTYGPRPNGAKEGALLACNADAFHSNKVRHGPTLENCHFEGMNDDGIPIHGAYALAVGGTAAAPIAEAVKAPWCREGDHLRFVDELGVEEKNAVVTKVEPLPDYKPEPSDRKDLRMFQNATHPAYFKITLDKPVETKPGWLISNADATGNNFAIRKCTIQNHRARGMLIKASSGVIEDCLVESSSIGGIVVAPEMGYWNESDYAQNLFIRRNTIRSCGYWQGPGTAQGAALVVEGFENGKFAPLPGGHRHLVIEDNTFEDNDGPNIIVSSTMDIAIRNNRFLRPLMRANLHGSAVGVDPGALIWVTETRGVGLMGNLVIDPGGFLKTLIIHSATVTGSGFEDGVVIQKKK